MLSIIRFIKNEAFTVFLGNEYAQRLRDQYSKMIENSDIFGWAALPKESLNKDF
jgi:hypothetical protein